MIEPLWGEPAMAALRAIAPEGRLVNVGQSAGTDVRLPLDDVTAAWERQDASPGRKLVISVGQRA